MAVLRVPRFNVKLNWSSMPPKKDLLVHSTTVVVGCQEYIPIQVVVVILRRGASLLLFRATSAVRTHKTPSPNLK